MTPSPAEVAEMASVMHRHAIQRLVGDGFVLELHPSAFSVAPITASPDGLDGLLASRAGEESEGPCQLCGRSAAAHRTGPETCRGYIAPSERCLCGHEKDAEHNDNDLCLLGCPVALCHPETVKPKE